MRLIVFPGGGSPRGPRYRKVYELIEGEAARRGLSGATTILYPAHDRDGESASAALTLSGAIEAALPVIEEHEARGEPYDFLGRSFGTIVATRLAIERKPRHLRRLVLWGPVAYWILWEMLARDLPSTAREGAAKGVRLGPETFPSAQPLESLLSTLAYPAVIATGTKDPQAPPAHLDYLRALFGGRADFSFRVVPDAFHEVTTENCAPPVVRAYLDVVFGGAST